jgi:hypothetical protein
MFQFLLKKYKKNNSNFIPKKRTLFVYLFYKAQHQGESSSKFLNNEPQIKKPPPNFFDEGLHVAI